MNPDWAEQLAEETIKEIEETDEKIENRLPQITDEQVEMYFLENGGIVIDNPGVREVGMTDMNVGVNSLFDEIRILAKKCKFVNCTHIHEPGCEVLSALKLGKLNEDKYSNYIRLKKETEYYKMTELEKKEKDHQFGKFIKKAKKGFEKL